MSNQSGRPPGELSPREQKRDRIRKRIETKLRQIHEGKADPMTAKVIAAGTCTAALVRTVATELGLRGCISDDR